MSFAFSLPIVVGLTFAAYRTRAVTGLGAVTGALLALIYASSPTPAPFATFVLFVVLGSVASRLGADVKRRVGALQENGGRRGPRHALANCGVGALALLMGVIFDGVSLDLAEYLAVASLAAALADTCATEWGLWLGGRPRHILTWRPLAPGTDGGVTPVGLLAALLAASLAGAVASIWLRPSLAAAGLMAVCGFGGSLVDSVLGATVERGFGRRGNEIVNFLGSASGLGLAALLLR